ncbi:MAG TPA: 30S ribosomal protein S1 [Longimicrobiales bacterium]|nr:30S ribosomal protein S1 [Longimicrobiales bacterium]
MADKKDETPETPDENVEVEGDQVEDTPDTEASDTEAPEDAAADEAAETEEAADEAEDEAAEEAAEPEDDESDESEDAADEAADSEDEETDEEESVEDQPTAEELEEEANVSVDAFTGQVIEGDFDDDDTTGIDPLLKYDPYGEEELDIPRSEFAALLGEYEEDFAGIREGEIVKASVLDVTDTAVILEFGFKSEGSVAQDEFKEVPEIGDEVEVLLESLEDEDGIVVLSKKKADFLRVWEKIKDAYEEDRPVKGTLVRKIKGGVTVDLMGVDAFLPGSQIALRRVPNIEDLVGEVYNFKIIKLNKRRRNIVVSRRVILEADREKKRETLVKELLVGQVREGTVKNITDFGAFIDLGGLDGLLHITDMSWGRVANPNEVVSIGEELDIKVLDIDWDRERISLGLKQLLPYPWTDIDKKYPVGARVKGRVVSITNYGAFIELEKGVEGLVHISEMSWTRNVRHPSKLVAIGDEIEAVVLKVDPDDEKISLGMKQIEEDPWLALPVKYPTGTTLEGVVRNLTSFGAFVEIEPGIDGLVHVSDMSWTKRVEHPSEIVQKGEEVEVMVLDVDAENKRISLGLKQIQDDPWPTISERFTTGMEVEGTVVRLADGGVYFDLGDDIEAFMPGHNAGVSDQSKLEEYYRPGETVSLTIMDSDAANRRITLQVVELPEHRDVVEEAEEAEAEDEVTSEADDSADESEDDESDDDEDDESDDEDDESGDDSDEDDDSDDGDDSEDDSDEESDDDEEESDDESDDDDDASEPADDDADDEDDDKS